MASHQETNGVPNHANARLLTAVWRTLFNASDSFIASDAGDIKALTHFGVAINCTDASALAINAGMDQ
jgi:beta-glucosidase-like glycosyl hydrolase